MSTVVDAVEAIRCAAQSVGVPPDVAKVVEQIVLNNANPKELVEPRLSPIPWTVGSIVKRLHREALKLQELIGPELISDPGLYMLLALYADTENDRENSVTSLVQASGSPPTTALRYLTVMESHGMLERHAHPIDRRSWVVRPTAKTMMIMRAAVHRLCAPGPDLPVAT